MSYTYNCGHGCSVTCPDGGGCLYDHDSGDCFTLCSDEDIQERSEKIETLKKIAKNLKSGGKIDIKLENISYSDLSQLMNVLEIH